VQMAPTYLVAGLTIGYSGVYVPEEPPTRYAEDSVRPMGSAWDM
jgi:hypothetical protein